MKNGNSINLGCSHEEKRKLRSPTVPEETFSAWMSCVGFFLEIHDVLKFSDIQLCSQGKMKQRPFLSSAFVHRSPISFHSFFFLLFSLFFLLSFFFINYDKVFFLFFSSAFVLVFPRVSNAARRCQQRSSTGRSTPLLLNPSPSTQKVLLNRG